jgi:hypothetical protein
MLKNQTIRRGVAKRNSPEESRASTYLTEPSPSTLVCLKHPHPHSFLPVYAQIEGLITWAKLSHFAELSRLSELTFELRLHAPR